MLQQKQLDKSKIFFLISSEYSPFIHIKDSLYKPKQGFTQGEKM